MNDHSNELMITTLKQGDQITFPVVGCLARIHFIAKVRI
jgi:hypothetical protein